MSIFEQRITKAYRFPADNEYVYNCPVCHESMYLSYHKDAVFCQMCQKRYELDSYKRLITPIDYQDIEI